MMENVDGMDYSPCSHEEMGKGKPGRRGRNTQEGLNRL